MKNSFTLIIVSHMHLSCRNLVHIFYRMTEIGNMQLPKIKEYKIIFNVSAMWFVYLGYFFAGQ